MSTCVVLPLLTIANRQYRFKAGVTANRTTFVALLVVALLRNVVYGLVITTSMPFGSFIVLNSVPNSQRFIYGSIVIGVSAPLL